jgi:hypothetical protein
MGTLIIRHRLKDYNKWRQVFDRHEEGWQEPARKSAQCTTMTPGRRA